MTEPRISRADVKHVARLARLELSGAEIDEYTDQLATILAHADDIAALDTDGIPPTAHPLPVRNVLRPDETRPCLDRDEVLAAAPDTDEGRFRVPPVLGEQV